MAVLQITGIGISSGFFRFVFRYSEPAFVSAKQFFGAHLTELLGTLIIVLAGVFLFWLRENHTTKYALGELGFAIATAWTTIERVANVSDPSAWVGLSAAAYLVVRGCDNLNKGLSKNPLGWMWPFRSAAPSQPDDQNAQPA